MYLLDYYSWVAGNTAEFCHNAIHIAHCQAWYYIIVIDAWQLHKLSIVVLYCTFISVFACFQYDAQ
jgi:hypothetical protein